MIYPIGDMVIKDSSFTNVTVKTDKTHNTCRATGGFTIVELLVAIIVIAILAAIAIVAYSGTQQRAIVASLTSDLNNASKQLKIDQVTLSAYPATTTLANNGAGLQASNNTTYQYTVNNATNPQTFCVTATNGTTSYSITHDSSPASGGCAGHGVGGTAAITNLITNPSLETNSTGWGAYVGVNTPTRVTTTPWIGSARLSAVGNGTSINPRVLYILPVTVGDTLSISLRVRSDGQTPNSAFFVIKTRLAGAETSTPVNIYPTWTPDANGWVPVAATLTIPANVDDLMIQPGVSTSINYTGTMGVDGVIVAKSPTAVNYADGNSTNWIWNGTANNSTSTGPPL